MSGSNAIAAAKRRRGGSDPKGPSPPGSQRNVQNNSQQPQPVTPSSLNPLQLVAFNHQRLNKLADELPKSVDALGESFNALSSNCDFLHDQFNVLEKQVGLLVTNQSSHTSSVQSVPSVDVSRFEQLGKDVDEVHRVITRMQSFAMDLSNSISKTKEQFDTYTNNINQNMNQINTRTDLLEQKINHLYSVEQRLVDTNNKLDKLDNMIENLVNSSNVELDGDGDGEVDDDAVENESQEVDIEQSSG